MTDKVVNVLGVDTSLRSTGVGVVSVRGNRLSCVDCAVLKTPAGRPVSECLRRLSSGIIDVLDRLSPEAVAIEGAFFQKNARTAMILGEARGTVIAACACRGLPVYEYAPRRVKQAVVGFGSADKEQVRRMVLSILGLREEPPMDASDALAIAICHVHSRSGHKELMPEPI